MNKEELSKRVEFLIGDGSVRKFSRISGVNEGTLRSILKGTRPSVDIASAIARVGKVSLDWLITGEGPMRPGESGELVNIKRINAKLSAGGGAWNELVEVIDHIPFTREFLRKIGRADTDNLTILEAMGDSMEPTIGDGDLVLIDEATTYGDGIYAIVFDGLAMVKRLRRKSLSTIEIVSDNSAIYPPFEVDNPDQLHIIGKAIWRGHLFG